MDVLETQGIRLPRLGLGTFRMPSEECRPAVESALALGYRHIDTAEMYGNEEGVGQALASSSVSRGDIHLTTKVWHEHLAPEAIRRALDTSLSKLKTDYVDLFLVHWPSPVMDLPAVMHTMVKLKEEGLARAIGVCNFPLALLRQAVEDIQAPVACNQIEFHALLDQQPVRAYAQSKGIPIIAYCPLAQGQLANSPELAPIARKHGATQAQVALKWLLDQKGVAAIPKARQAANQRSNLDALQLTLDDADRAVIDALPKSRRLVSPPFAPAWDPLPR